MSNCFTSGQKIKKIMWEDGASCITAGENGWKDIEVVIEADGSIWFVSRREDNEIWKHNARFIDTVVLK